MAKFKLYNFEKEGKGVYRGEQKNRVALYFSILWRKLWSICKLSLICSIFVIPVALIIASLVFLQYTNGINAIFYPVCFAPIIILGPIMTGAMRIARDFAREEPVFIWSDFFATVKKNFKQSIIVSAISYVIASLLYIAVAFYLSAIANSVFYVILFGLGLMFTMLFLFMQYYIWLMIVSMGLNIKQLFKNAAIFSIVCLWKNFLITLILLAIVVLLYFIIVFSIAIQVLVPIWIILTFGFLIGFMLYTIAFIAYPSIKRYAIDPYYEEHKEETAEGVKNASEEDELPEYVYENGKMVHRSVIENNPESIFDDNPKLK